MLDPAFPPVDLSEFNTTDFVKSITMPEKETTYWCTMFERSAAHKSHIVAVIYISIIQKIQNATWVY